MVAICPCCRQTVTASALLVSLDTMEAVRGEVRVPLRLQEARLLAELHAAAPGTSRRDALMYALWELEEGPNDPKAAISAVVSRLREKLKPLGARIAAVPNIGYRLELS